MQMKSKSIIIIVALGVALLFWNIYEFPDFQIDESKVKNIPIHESVDVPHLEWSWFDAVKVQVREGICKLKSLPPQIEALEGKKVVVSGPSFACGSDIIERTDGYTIKGFIMVPYFGMIDCCVGNPIPYFQWTVIVKPLAQPWEIHHKGIVDPDVVVSGVFRIERGTSREGIFFLDNAVVIKSVDSEKQVE